VGDTVRCPWHHACFSLRNGEALRAPALDPVPCWRVERLGDAIFVREKVSPPAPNRGTEGPSSVVIVGGGAAGLAAADMLRRELDPIPEAARGLRLERLRNEVNDVAALLRRAITARPEQQRRLLNAMAVCTLEGFWLPPTVEIAGLTQAEGREARNRLVDASLLRMLDRDRQHFQLHALLREELLNLAPLAELQAAHAAALEGAVC